MTLFRSFASVCALLLTLTASATAEDAASETLLDWHTDYAEARDTAKDEQKMLCIVFRDSRFPKEYRDYIASLEADAKFVKASQKFVLCQLPLEEEVVAESGKPAIKLIAHPAFAEMKQRPGIAVLDYANPEGAQYGRVVSIYPFKTHFLSAPRVIAMMDLPEGSLTQRTMIFAVMSHPEKPASIQAKFTPVLADETASHSQHQANIGVQGHHQWDSRFQRINARLGRGMVSQEVVAESWPGQDLVDAAEECVASWRQSSGHWSAVRSRPAAFAYDIKRGRNGVWYATGIFGR